MNTPLRLTALVGSIGRLDLDMGCKTSRTAETAQLSHRLLHFLSNSCILLWFVTF